MRRLIYDIETSPNEGYFWRSGYKIDVGYQSITREKQIITIAYKWHGSKKSNVLTWDGPLASDKADKAMLEKFIPVLNEADECVAHFGDSFDLPWIRSRAIYHGIPMLPKYKTVDTCAWARKHFHFNSNKLDYLAKYFGVGEKLDAPYELWKDVIDGRTRAIRTKALSEMADYNLHDVLLLEKVYDKMVAYVPVKTHAGVVDGRDKWTCAHCASTNVQSKGHHQITAKGSINHLMQCQACGRYYCISDPVFKEFKNERKIRTGARR